MKRPIESDYISQVAYTRALEAYCDEILQKAHDWRNVAIRVGEELSSVGPDGYYDMTADQWIDWAMAQKPHGTLSLAQQDLIRRAEEAFEASQQLIQSYLEKDNLQQNQCKYPNCDYPCMDLPDCQKTEDLYDLAVKADNGGQP